MNIVATHQTYQDGDTSTVSAALDHQPTPSLSASAGLGFERSAPKTAHLKYDSYKLFGSVSKTWEGGLFTSFGITAGQRDFTDIYPLTTTPRADEFYKIDIGAQQSRIDIHGFTPRLDCSYTINRSNVSFYDYRATECQVTMTRHF